MSSELTPEQREVALRMIEDPPFGSALEKAKRWGVDLHTLVDNLCLTPTQRARNWSRRVNLMLERARRKQLKKAMRKNKAKADLLHPPAEAKE